MPDPKTCYEIAQIGEEKWGSFDIATKSALAILADCLDRRGIKREFCGVDDEILDEIIDAWADIIRIAFNEEL